MVMSMAMIIMYVLTILESDFSALPEAALSVTTLDYSLLMSKGTET